MVTDMATINKHLGVGAGVDAGLFVLFRTKRVCHLMRVRARKWVCEFVCSSGDEIPRDR